jgi:alginate O-acetyltransferase complex protein AlgI
MKRTIAETPHVSGIPTMLFNSLEFLLFAVLSFSIYWYVFGKSLRLQNAFILVASYVFYGWWDWRFLSLILFSTILDYYASLGIASSFLKTRKRLWLIASLSVNLGLLGLFKYYNFFVTSLMDALSNVGVDLNLQTLRIILPVGISFYTFQTLSYTIDVYRGKLEPSRDFVQFAAYVSFFPQLVAGPIERATSLLPQFSRTRVFDRGKAVDGLRQILWGLLKKVLIADNCAVYVNLIFDNSDTMNGSSLVLGSVFFAFQIYGDFSGYSDIAIGTARLFGFSLMRNFAFPYFSRDIAEFWRRWHISLSTWFRDYLYIPIGGNKGSRWHQIRNTMIVFVVSGFWHGANWTFIAWGALNALFFLPLLLLQRNRQNLDTVAYGRFWPRPAEVLAMGTTFALTLLAWIFFRANSIQHAVSYLSGIISPTLFSAPAYHGVRSSYLTLAFITMFVLVEWIGREGQYALENLGRSWPRIGRWALYLSLIFVLGMFMRSEETPFIYFQF